MKQLFVLALAALLLAGCSEKNVASMNAVIARQKVAVYHDDERGVTCWIFWVIKRAAFRVCRTACLEGSDMTQKQDAQYWIDFMSEANLHPALNGREAAREYNELRAENERLHSWDGLMSLLDEMYPASVFDGSSGDSGPLIIVHLREIQRLRAAGGE